MKKLLAVGILVAVVGAFFALALVLGDLRALMIGGVFVGCVVTGIAAGWALDGQFSQ